MKKHVFAILALVLSAFSALAQDVFIQIDANGIVNNKINKELGKGTKFKSLIIKSVPSENKSTFVKTISVVKDNGEVAEFDYSKKFADDFIFPYSVESFWKSKAISENVYVNMMENGIQYDLRNSLDEECLDYLRFLDSNGSFLEDYYIKDYLHSIFLKIYPDPLNDGRTSQLDIRILRTNEPYAAILANGTALVSIGMLNLVNSEEELTAVLAHEAAHFVLDHPVLNINAEIKRQKRAEFWSGLATLAVAAGSAYVAIEHDIYFDPSIISNTAVLATAISAEINQRIGMKYSRDQETKADECAGQLIGYLGSDKDALSSVLAKLRDYHYKNGNYKVFSDNGSHPNINYRIEMLGGVKNNYSSVEYDRKISSLLTQGAYHEYYRSHFQTCEDLLKRNIKSGAATEEDYILMALVNLAQYNTDDKYKESLAYLTKAKTLGVAPDYQVHKVETLVHLRKDDSASAIKSLKEYQQALKDHLEGIDPSWLASDAWTRQNDRINDELIWTRKLLFKLGN